MARPTVPGCAFGLPRAPRAFPPCRPRSRGDRREVNTGRHGALFAVANRQSQAGKARPLAAPRGASHPIYHEDHSVPNTTLGRRPGLSGFARGLVCLRSPSSVAGAALGRARPLNDRGSTRATAHDAERHKFGPCPPSRLGRRLLAGVCRQAPAYQWSSVNGWPIAAMRVRFHWRRKFRCGSAASRPRSLLTPLPMFFSHLRRRAEFRSGPPRDFRTIPRFTLFGLEWGRAPVNPPQGP